MGPNNSAQDVVRCDLCKTVIVQSYCDYCHVKLCKPCIGEHISDDHEKHRIVPFQHQKYTLIYPKCETHQNEYCKYQCIDCHVFICFECLASKEHSREHEFVKFKEVFITKKGHIQKDSEELKTQILPVYEEIANELEM